MDQSGNNQQTQFCPQCGNHCPAGHLQCGRGEQYFNQEHENHDFSRGHGRSHNHEHGHDRNHHHHRERDVEWDDLAGKFERCGRLISHCLGKRRGQGRILRTLYQRGEMSQKELQDLLGIQAGSMSEIAVKLENKGLIARGRGEEDRRKVFLSITQQGRDWVARSDEEHIRQHRAKLFSSLTAEEQAALESCLDKLLADWSQRSEPRGQRCPDGRNSCREKQ